MSNSLADPSVNQNSMFHKEISHSGEYLRWSNISELESGVMPSRMIDKLFLLNCETTNKAFNFILEEAEKLDLTPIFDGQYGDFSLHNNEIIIECGLNKTSKLFSLSCILYGPDTLTVEAYKGALETAFDPKIVKGNIFELDWYFTDLKGNTHTARVKEVFSDVLLDSAYPVFDKGLDSFVDAYLESDEPILILQGPPGTGKTRLIRYILSKIKPSFNECPQCMYTGDEKVFESEETYVDFVAGDCDAFIIEDADYLLEERKDGNKLMHHFLTAADGIIRSHGRKIIFSTNLANNIHIDEALTRPGRCFGRYKLEQLETEQTKHLIQELGAESGSTYQALVDKYGKDKFSLAEIYKQVNNG